MRVLFSSSAGVGHIFPMLPLAQAFRELGHDVLWATSAGSHGLVSEAGVPVTAAGLTGDELASARGALHARAALLPPAERAGFLFPHMFGGAFTAPMLGDLLPIAEEWRPDVLVHEHGEMASAIVGAVLGVPSVTHAFGGAIPPAFVTEAGELTAGLWADRGLQQPPFAGCFETLYLDICPPSVESVPMDHIDRVQPLRPMPPVRERGGALPPYLHPDPRPLVYVTLGTVSNEASVLRRAVEAVAPLPVRVLVAVGANGDPDALGPQPANVRVERWVDQPLVLEHCAVVVSHAGSGTFLGALALGLPQLCLPQAADQFRNAAGGDRAGATLMLAPADATPEAICAAVQRLLSDDSFRTAAAVVADEIRAMPSPHHVVDVLSSLVHNGT